MERILGYEELKVLATEPQPEGVIIADAVDGLMEKYEEERDELVENRNTLGAEFSKAKIEACEAVLADIKDRYGYVSLRRERCL